MYEYKIRDPELRKLAQRSAADEALDAVSSAQRDWIARGREQRVALRGSLADARDLDRPQALRILMHTAIGRSSQSHFPNTTLDELADHLVTASRSNNKEASMDSLSKLRDAIAGMTEHQRVDFLMNEVALKDRRPNETPAQSFARHYRDDAAFQKFAQGILPDDDESDDDNNDPLEILDSLAEVRRRAEPTLSKAQAFAKVYQDPENRELVRIVRERNGFRKAGNTIDLPQLRTRPAVTGGRAANAAADGGKTAYEQLVDLTNEQFNRVNDGTQTFAQVFAQVYAMNPELAAQERRENRPA
jgi:hypothetical protein